jgi:hypothetical protein
MEKKPLIVISMCAVVLLVLGSLTNVVGYQSVKSTVTDSPLFQTRMQRATNQQQNILTFQYLGMGEKAVLRFPLQGNNNDMVDKLFALIHRLDTKTLERLTELCIQKITKDGSSLEIGVVSGNTSQTGSQILPTCSSVTVCGNWAPGCFLKDVILEVLSMIIDFVKNGFQWPTYTWFCWPSGQIPCNVNLFNIS